MNYISNKTFTSNANGKKYKKEDVITLHELNTLSYHEKTQNFYLKYDKVPEQVGIGNDLNNEL